MTERKKKTKSIRHTENPFLTNEPVLFSKKWQISRFGKEQGLAINNLEKSKGGTAFIKYQKVDDAQFIKLFSQNIKLAFELTQAGQKALYVVFWAIQNNSRNKDTVLLDQYTLEEFLSQYPDLRMSLPTFWRGLSELVKSQILAMAKRKSFYFINPHFAFNGDRVAFATILERGKIEKAEVLEIESES